MDDPTAPLNATFTELLKALGDNRSTISISIFPRDLVDGDQVELLGRYTVLELPEGAIASDDDMARADFVLVGGLVVKNRDGPVFGYATQNNWSDIGGLGAGRPRDDAEIDPPAGERVADPDVATLHLAQGIFSGTLRGDELRAIIENSPRLAQALCRGLERLSRAHWGTDITYDRLKRHADKGRLTAKVVIGALVAELTKPGEKMTDGAAAEPMKWRTQHDRLCWLLGGINALLEIVGKPIPMGIRDLADMGHIPARHMAKALFGEFTLLRALVAYEIDAITHENAGGDSRQAEPDAGGLRGAAIDTLRCLYMHGPTFDGDVPSKSGRDELAAGGLIERGCDGYQWLTAAGVATSIALGFHDEKERLRQGR